MWVIVGQSGTLLFLATLIHSLALSPATKGGELRHDWNDGLKHLQLF